MTTRREQASGRTAAARLALRVTGAGLLIASAAIHLDLYLTGYRTIPTIGPLFLLQVIVGFALGALVLATGNRLVAAAAAGFALSTLGGYLLTVQFGLFGFREVRTTAGIVAGIIEVAAFAALAALAAMPSSRSAAAWSRRKQPAGSAATLDSARLSSAQAASAAGRSASFRSGGRIPYAAPAVAAISVVALGLLAGALAAAGGTAGSGQGPALAAGGTLRTEVVGGKTILANAQGRTLYSFAPDTSGKSTCYGTCAQYWPPVGGPAHAGNGVTGTLGTTTRTGGSLQETYNGHPLYTYVGDTAPGQANGNNVDLNGGFWHEIVISP